MTGVVFLWLLPIAPFTWVARTAARRGCDPRVWAVGTVAWVVAWHAVAGEALATIDAGGPVFVALLVLTSVLDGDFVLSMRAVFRLAAFAPLGAAARKRRHAPDRPPRGPL